MNKFGLLECSWGLRLVEYSPSRGLVWIHSSSECIGCDIDKIDFDFEHLIDFLLSEEGRYSWGTYLPRYIVEELEKRVDKNDDWLMRQLDFMKYQLDYPARMKNRLK